MAHIPSNAVELGWSARPMKEQHPILSDEVASNFDKDNVALVRLSMRGYLTDAQKKAARAKLVKEIGREIRAAIAKAGGRS